MTKEQLERLSNNCGISGASMEEEDEIFRLARIGLWVTEHEKAIKSGLDAGDRFYYGHKSYTEALKAFPKETQ